ncbi:MAG: glycosyltransferase [Acidobacteriota bacterium]
MPSHRLLILSHLFPNAAFPYEGTYIAEVLPHLEEYGWRARTLVLKDLLPNTHHLAGSGKPARLIERYLASHRLAKENDHGAVTRCLYLRLPRLHRNYALWQRWLAWQVVPRAIRLHRASPFNAILGYTLVPGASVAVALSKRLGIPAVAYARGSDLHSIPPGKENRAALAQIVRSSQLTLAVSQDLQRRALQIAPQANVQVLPSGVDTALFSPDGGEADLGPGRHLLFVSYLKPVKDPLLAVKAFLALRRERSDVVLHLVGDGRLRGSLQRLVERNGLRNAVRFYGIVARKQVAALLRRADVLILSSREEGWPRVVLEALSVGTPVVATRVGGVPEMLVDDRLGLIVDSRDPEEMAAALKDALSRKWDRSRLRAQAVRYAWPSVAHKLAQVLDEVVEVHQSATRAV